MMVGYYLKNTYTFLGFCAVIRLDCVLVGQAPSHFTKKEGNL